MSGLIAFFASTLCSTNSTCSGVILRSCKKLFVTWGICGGLLGAGVQPSHSWEMCHYLCSEAGWSLTWQSPTYPLSRTTNAYYQLCCHTPFTWCHTFIAGWLPLFSLPLQPKTCETSLIHLHALYVVSEDNLQITPISKLWPVADLTLYMWSTCSLTVPAHPPSLCTAGKT